VNGTRTILLRAKEALTIGTLGVAVAGRESTATNQRRTNAEPR